MTFWHHEPSTNLLNNSDTGSWFSQGDKEKIVIVFIKDEIIPMRKDDLSLKDFQRIKSSDNAKIVITDGETVGRVLAKLGDEER